MKLKEKIVSLLAAGILLMGTAAPALALEQKVEFPDVPRWAWYAQAVDALAEQGIIDGMPDGSFQPKGNITRAQFLKLLATASGQVIQGNEFQQKFSDVPENAWYASYVAWALKEELISGVGNGRFAPNALITRQQMAVILYRFNKNAMGKRLPKYQKTNFRDASSVSEWASVEVAAVEAAGLMKGYGDRTFRPRKNATRAEAAQILYQYLSDYSEYGQGCSIDQLRYVVHGGGRVADTYSVSNSLEALQESISHGNMTIEVDFCWTTDNELVCVHSWGGVYPPRCTLNEFLNIRIFDRFTPLDLDGLAQWLRANPDARIIPDFKERSVEGLEMVAVRYPDLIEQFIPYLYHISDYDTIHSFGYENMILIPYQMPQEERDDIKRNVAFAREKEMAAIAYAPHGIGMAYLEESKGTGLPFLFFTVDSMERMRTYAQQGVDGFVTNLQDLKLQW